jgi:hypothetical protein
VLTEAAQGWFMADRRDRDVDDKVASAAALFHHFVLRDDVLHCMAPVIPVAPRKPEFSFGQVFGGRRTEAKGTSAAE